MDEIVKAALAKWPRVPHCHGWLGLDARGQWYMRDERVQAQGFFASESGACSSASKGSRLLHEKLIGFIQRNYAADELGQWFFQNGPQRVYVELEVAPYVWRLQPDGRVLAHTEVPAHVHECLLDERGRLYLATDLGLGLVHSADMALAGDAVESGRWVPQNVHSDTLARRFGFVRSPQRAWLASTAAAANPAA